MIVRYTLDEYMAGPVQQHVTDHSRGSRGSEGHSWDLGIPSAKAIQLARTGDPSVVSKFAVDVDTFSLASADESRMRYESSVAGTRVVVPAYLAGNPACMRRRAKRPAQTRHVAIYVNTTCSAGITANEMLRRGCAIVSLLETLQGIGVSVDLYLVADTHHSDESGALTQVIQLDTRPLDLARLGFVIAHPAFSRNVTYCVAEGIEEGSTRTHGGWPRGCYTHYIEAYTPTIRKNLGMAETDIYVPPVIYRDALVSDPERWIRERAQQVCSPNSETESECA